jgi:hypothetical protein
VSWFFFSIVFSCFRFSRFGLASFFWLSFLSFGHIVKKKRCVRALSSLGFLLSFSFYFVARERRKTQRVYDTDSGRRAGGHPLALLPASTQAALGLDVSKTSGGCQEWQPPHPDPNPTPIRQGINTCATRRRPTSWTKAWTMR